MKKIGIVTFYNHPNFGAVLQSYALQEYLSSLGFDSYHIDFNEEKVIENVPNHPLFKKIYGWKMKRNELFNNFINKYLKVIPFSPILEKETSLFIVGSDQVWNYEITKGNPIYFLNFTKSEKKSSYAASITFLDDKYKDYYYQGLHDFISISVREKSGKDIIDNLLKINSKICLDPTFLLSKDEWLKLVKPTLKEEKYLLLIMIQSSLTLYEEAKKLAQEKHLGFKLITASYFPQHDISSWTNVDVLDFLTLIKNASYVVSESFHGVAFSLIFEVPFQISKLGNQLEKRNSRIFDLLESINFHDNHFDETKLKEKILSSKNYLNDILRKIK